MGRTVRGANCPWGELSVGRTVCGVNCPWDEMSVGRAVHGANCPWGEMFVGRDVVGRVVMWQVFVGRVVVGRVSMGRVVQEPCNSMHEIFILLFFHENNQPGPFFHTIISFKSGAYFAQIFKFGTHSMYSANTEY
jgi:hypothetical protein